MRKRLFLAAAVLCAVAACSEDSAPEPTLRIEEPDVTHADVGRGGDAGDDAGDDCALTDTCDDVGDPVTPTTAVDGEACTLDSDCRGGTCIPHPEWPGGFCTTLGCMTFEDCASDGEDNRCLTLGQGENFCVRMCETQDDCREGYICQRLTRNARFCAPDPTPTLELDDLDSYPFDITCTEARDGVATFEYEIADDTIAYMVTPMSLDGMRLQPAHIALPSGRRIDLRGENAFQATPASLFGNLNPTIVPATERFASQLEAGRHTYTLNTSSREVCHYLLESKTPGTTIDFNVYLVGVDGITAATAPEDASMQGVLAQFDAIYAAAGIELGEVRFFDVTGAAATRYAVIRTEEAVSELVSMSEPHGDDLDANLSANIFFVRQFAFSGGGAIGISMGLPGPAALHGTHGSGVVFTSEYMGETFNEGGQTYDGDAFTGVVLAHEVGHYLGLFHTSEQYGRGFDPLPDTPECRSGFPNRCPDLGNLMFPLASIDHTTLTDDQSWVVRINPLTKD